MGVELRHTSTIGGGAGGLRADSSSPRGRLRYRRPMDVIIWHNPSCSKSRQALELLKQRGLEPTVRRYLQDPPSPEEIRSTLSKLGFEDPHGLVRKREKLNAELGVAEMTADEVIETMAEHPRLIERPVVIVGDRARIGRPTEAIEEVLPGG